ncbi:MAG: META domain-containing protein [Candidatus Marinimicrobia bacterium]|nr:META domain-containing protein [Candidatus Neomarinimicrobiota bacterium]
MQAPSFFPAVLLAVMVISTCDQPDAGNVITVPTDETYLLVLQEDSTASVTVYCNACFASYESGSDGSISIDVLGCTEMGCGESQVQDLFPSALHGATFWSIQANRLSILYSHNGENGTLEFEPDVLDEGNVPYPLIGTRWLLQSIQVD